MFNHNEILNYLKMPMEEAQKNLFPKSYAAKVERFGKNIYLRGLIEVSNICHKNCHYCGIRCDNNPSRYEMSEDEIMERVEFARSLKMNALVLQSGERSDASYIEKIASVLRKIRASQPAHLPFMQVTLSCGEQTKETYRYWRESGAFRYLLRIETSNRKLYEQMHPQDGQHDFDERLKALSYLKETDYKVGTGVMVGLPGQTLEDLAKDLIFFRESKVGMVGLGPYIEHEDTPLFREGHKSSFSRCQRVELTLKMLALLRLMRKEINIASTTALQTLEKDGRVRGLLVGANVFMPNITPDRYKQSYNLYQGKTQLKDDPKSIIDSIRAVEEKSGERISFYEEIL
jgi:biotin synthase